jgi:hypothetical protein
MAGAELCAGAADDAGAEQMRHHRSHPNAFTDPFGAAWGLPGYGRLMDAGDASVVLEPDLVQVRGPGGVSLGLLGAASFGNIHGRMEAIAVSRCPCSVASIWCAVVTGSVRVVARRQRRMKINTPRSPSSPSSTQLRIV